MQFSFLQGFQIFNQIVALFVREHAADDAGLVRPWRPLYGVFFVKEFARAAKLSFVGFLVRSQSPFLRPDLSIADVDARRICARLAVTPTLRRASPLPGYTLTASSKTAR